MSCMHNKIDNYKIFAVYTVIILIITGGLLGCSKSPAPVPHYQKPQVKYSNPPKTVKLAYSNDGKMVIISEDNIIRIWDVKSKKLLNVQRETYTVASVGFTDKGIPFCKHENKIDFPLCQHD